MGMQCPKCGGDHVQAVRAILQSGTSFSSGIVSGVGAGSGGGMFVGTTSGTSQTTLAARFSPPKKPTRGLMIFMGIVALATSPWLQANGPDVGFKYANMAIWLLLAYFVWSYRKESAVYKKQYPVWKAMHDDGFYCHRCGHAYISQ
jgi:ribosomal protein S27AE